jgi:acyl-CoA synthetase (AMP-forming)/AMP-acid ligase II
MNIAVAFLAAARTWSNNIAVTAPDGSPIRYAELAHRAGAIAGALKKRGLAPGDRVAVGMSNTTEYYEILLGIWIAGLCAVPLNPRLHAREFAHVVGNSDAKLCFASADLVSSLTGVGCDLAEVGSPGYHDLLTCAAIAPVERAPDDLAWLFYTSGTTGRPKGAMLTHRNVMAFITSMLADGGAMVHDNVLHIAPLSHGSGFLGLCYLLRGRTNVVLPQGGLDRASMTAVLERFAPVSFFAVPTVMNALMDGIVPPALACNIHMIYFGGAPMYVDDLRRALAFFGGERLWHLYGQGEAPMTITYLPPWLRGLSGDADYDARLASVGMARSGVAVCVMNEANGECRPGEIGEVAVRGDVVMSGYWCDPGATGAAFRDGWLLTGDLGAMDAAGFLTLHDRSKDMIISGGSNIYPREIEEVLLTFPGVRECAVIGVRDRKWGEVPVAFIVPSNKDAPDAAALDAHCLAHLARFKRPQSYRMVPELPKNGYGKVVKTILRQIADADRD